MKYVLISNYKPDQQESMSRYAHILHAGLTNEGYDSEIWFPIVFFSRGARSTIRGLGKWLGYLDKWILFPLVIKLRLFRLKYSSDKVYFHICDHSNSPYLAYLPNNRSGITCHDVLAIRGALGYKDAHSPASSTGKILQKWILRNLIKAQRLTAVSQYTMNQLLELCAEHGKTESTERWVVIHNSFNAHFWPMTENEKHLKLAEVSLDRSKEFILHVGSSLPRKNRRLLVDLLEKLGDKWDGYIYFAGEAIDEDLKRYIEQLGLEDRVISIIKPAHETLVALYSSCLAFVFPSLSEGFGWPLIEAQACGAPVIASNIKPMLEVSNGTALHADPTNADEFAKAFLNILQNSLRKELIAMGFENCKRFEQKKLIQDFINLYKN